MDKFNIITKIGDGAFGIVLKATQKSDNQLVAIKQMKKKFASWEECLWLREVKSLKLLGKHENIVQLKEVFLEQETLYFVFEYMESNLLDVIKAQKKKPFSSRQIQSITTQILQGLQHIHKNGFFHRDLKPENLLLSGQKVKIADFGLAREIRSRPPFTEYVSTRWYRAPEVLLRSTRYSSPIDLWGVGTIIAEMFMQRPLFPGSSELDQIYRVTSVLGTPQNGNVYYANRIPEHCRGMHIEEKGKASNSRYEFVYAGGGWSEGHKLAQAMGFRFSNLTPTPLDKLIPMAPREALVLLADLLAWNPSFRPTAQEALENPWLVAKSSTMLSTSALADLQSTQSVSASPSPVSDMSAARLSSSPTPTSSSSKDSSILSVHSSGSECAEVEVSKNSVRPGLVPVAAAPEQRKPNRKFNFSIANMFRKSTNKKDTTDLPRPPPAKDMQQTLRQSLLEQETPRAPPPSQNASPSERSAKAVQQVACVGITQKTSGSSSAYEARRRLINAATPPIGAPPSKPMNSMTKKEAIDSILSEIDSIDTDFIL